MLSLSPITLIKGSVPDFRTKILPWPLIFSLDNLINFLIFGSLSIFSFLHLTFSKI
jgi:hypothetical protein